MIDYRVFGSEKIEEVFNIYEENGWTSYLDSKERLVKAFQNSLYILGAFDGDKLVAFVRCIGDGEYILYVQDLIVLPAYQRQGIGRGLMSRVSLLYKGVRQFVLITDSDDEKSNAFYQAIGMVKDCNGYAVNHYFRA